MKVLHILNELKPSGAEIMIEIAADLFKKNNIKIDILGTGQEIGSFANNFKIKKYGVYHIPFKKYWRFISPVFLYHVFKFLNNNKYDVVHIHPEQGRMSYAIVAYLAKSRGIVTTVHHIFPPNDNLFSFIPIMAKFFRRWVMRNMLNTVIISNSKSGLLNEKIHYKSNNILIPNWFDNNKYQPEVGNELREKCRGKLDIDNKSIVFVSLGGNWEYKNYNLILDAMSEIDDMNVVYLQIGPDEEGLLKKQKKFLNLGGNVKLIGRVDDVLPYLYASDVYIMPSSIEGFGVAAVEAMAAGLPAILSNRPALFDFKSDSAEIVFIEPNPDEICKSMLLFKEMGDEKIKKKGQIISKKIIKKYGLTNGAQKHVDLYRKLIAQK